MTPVFRRTALSLLVGLLLICSVLALLFSCIVTASDGQGALIFIFTLPLMAVLLFVSQLLARHITKEAASFRPLLTTTIVLSWAQGLFFVMLLIPGLQVVPQTAIGFLGKAFSAVTGKSPYAFFRDRKAFATLLAKELEQSESTSVDLGALEVTFAWDRVCILGPYTNNARAKEVMGLDFDLESRSDIEHSDSVNALVFLYEGKVNNVVDLKRGVTDFKVLDVCLERRETVFLRSRDANGLPFLERSTP